MSVERSELNVERSGSGPPQAVFLSYSREDLPAARRIADALSAFEVEVWFDQDGLEGGDAWDQKIRRQIKECALFIPVISASTQARREAYFRLEWKLAEERTHLMADGTSFLLPIAIDDTPEAGALVPESFLRTQWTRLPRGVPNTAFVERVRALLAKPLHAPPAAAPGRPELKIAGQPEKRIVAIGMAAALVVAAGGWFWLQRQKTAALVTEATPAISDKSIAVLPFTNMSADKENGYFADGVQEDILTSLQNIGDLQVISSPSVLEYRGTTKKIQQIARELGVRYVLKGSVRRDGDQIRIVCQLIDGRTGAYALAPPPYDRPLKDIFAIQSELAKAITTELQALLSPQEKARLERAPTTNTAAYDSYLKALEIKNGGFDPERLTRAESLLESAVELDPKFTLAWGQLVSTQILMVNRIDDPSGFYRERVRQTVDTVKLLVPDDPATWVILTKYFLTDFARDDVLAESYLQRAAQALPNNGQVALLLAEMARRHGRWPDALAHFRRAHTLDQQDPNIRRVFQAWLQSIRRYDEAAVLASENQANGFELAMLPFYERGSTREMEAWMATHPQPSGELVSNWYMNIGDAAGFVRIKDEGRRNLPNSLYSVIVESQYADALMALGRTEQAREAATRNLARLKAAGIVSGYAPALNLTVLGDMPAALRAWDAEVAKSRKAGIDPDYHDTYGQRAVILASMGEKENALSELARLLKIPGGVNVNVLRHNWQYRMLQGDLRFEALLNDAKNNAPLF
jgi:TolB-like protein/thioredoxin-like negative regulator of GroEL